MYGVKIDVMSCKVSIIIPVYNVAPYLSECLDSAVQQTLQDIEIICVDDASTDGSRRILDEYAARDARVKVFANKVNQGLPYTRNVGLAQATGEYVYFLDSDDWIDVHAMQKLVNISDQNQLDLLFFSIQAFGEGLEEAELRKNWNYQRTGTYEGIYYGAELFARFIENGDQYVNAVDMLIRRRFLRDHEIAFHSDVKVHEDVPFYFETILQASRAMCIPDAFYHRRVRPGSIMTTALSARNVRAYLLLYVKLCEFSMRVNIPGEYRGAASAFMESFHRMLETYTGRIRAYDDLADDGLKTLFEAYVYDQASRNAAWELQAVPLIEQIKKHRERKAVIYGAGMWGKRLACMLDRNGISDFVFAVTNPADAGTYCLGQQVRCIDDFIDGTEQWQSVIAANQKNQSAMADYLRDRGMKDFMTVWGVDEVTS